MKEEKVLNNPPRMIRGRGGKMMTEDEFRSMCEEKEREYQEWWDSLTPFAKFRKKFIRKFNKDHVALATLVFTLLTFIEVMFGQRLNADSK